MSHRNCVQFVAFLIIVIKLTSSDDGCVEKRVQNKQSLIGRFYIVGGVNASKKDFPYIVLFKGSGDPFCGGSIIKKNWIVTARHCMIFDIKKIKVVAPKIDDITMLLKAHYSQNGQAKKVYQKFLFGTIEAIYKYKFDENRTQDNDIALVKLKHAIVFDKHLQPIKLSKRRPKPGSNLKVCGWGAIARDGWTRGPQLKKLSVRVVNDTTCRTRLGPCFAKANQFCTISGGDSCQGDSGGPIVLKGKTPKDDVLVGLTSWGHGSDSQGIKCGLRSSDGHIYGSYASIFELRKWIKKIMDYKGEHKDFVDDNTDVLYNKDFH